MILLQSAITLGYNLKIKLTNDVLIYKIMYFAILETATIGISALEINTLNVYILMHINDL